MSRKIFVSLAVLGILAVLLFVVFISVRQNQGIRLFALARLFSEDSRTQNFQHMERIFPMRTMARSDHPLAFPTESKPVEREWTVGQGAMTVEDVLRKTTTAGLFVLKDGKIAYQYYGLGASPSSKFTSWSVAKSIVSALVGIAVEEKAIASIDDPLTKYLSKLEGSGFAGVSVRHALNMASGINFDENYSDDFSDINLFFFKLFFLGRSMENVLSSIPKGVGPGKECDYVSPNTQVLSLLVSQATGKALSVYAREKLWNPLGAESEAYWNLDRKDGTELGFCCFNATLRDFARFGQLYLNGGTWQGKTLVPSKWVEASMRPETDYQQPGRISGLSLGYQHQWWIPPTSDGEMVAMGVWGQFIYINRPKNTVIVKASVDPDFEKHWDLNIEFFRTLATRMGG